MFCGIPSITHNIVIVPNNSMYWKVSAHVMSRARVEGFALEKCGAIMRYVNVVSSVNHGQVVGLCHVISV